MALGASELGLSPSELAARFSVPRGLALREKEGLLHPAGIRATLHQLQALWLGFGCLQGLVLRATSVDSGAFVSRCRASRPDWFERHFSWWRPLLDNSFMRFTWP